MTTFDDNPVRLSKGEKWKFKTEFTKEDRYVS